jgi:hypothetical protein
MSSFGSLFPDSVREDFSSRMIQPGSVFRIPVTNTTPPKTKRLVILAISGDKACAGCLFLNSQINPNVFSTARLRGLHLPLEADGREYLDHNSYLDCSDIKDMDLNGLKEIISRDPSQHIGKLNDTDLQTAKEKLKNAPTISKKQKEKYALI